MNYFEFALFVGVSWGTPVLVSGLAVCLTGGGKHSCKDCEHRYRVKGEGQHRCKLADGKLLDRKECEPWPPPPDWCPLKKRD